MIRGKISFKLPIKIEENAVIATKNSGKILLDKHVSIGSNVHIEAKKKGVIKIGSYTGINANAMIMSHEGVTIGSNVMIGPNVCIYDHDHVYKTKDIMRYAGYNTAPVIVEDNVWIGAGVIILKGVTIGENSVIGAGTIVNKDIPANSIAYNSKKLEIKPKF